MSVLIDKSTRLVVQGITGGLDVDGQVMVGTYKGKCQLCLVFILLGSVRQAHGNKAEIL